MSLWYTHTNTHREKHIHTSWYAEPQRKKKKTKILFPVAPNKTSLQSARTLGVGTWNWPCFSFLVGLDVIIREWDISYHKLVLFVLHVWPGQVSECQHHSLHIGLQLETTVHPKWAAPGSSCHHITKKEIFLPTLHTSPCLCVSTELLTGPCRGRGSRGPHGEEQESKDGFF